MISIRIQPKSSLHSAKVITILQTRTNLKHHKMSNICVVPTSFVNTKIKIKSMF